MASLLVIDNYDSFTYNLVQMFMRYDLYIQVHRSDRIELNRIAQEPPDYILVSPGPKDPSHAGISKALIRRFCPKIPILGVCLGMQCINEVFDGRTVRSPTPMHGKTSPVHHRHKALFADIPSPFRAARYHSLAVEPSAATLAQGLMITGQTPDGIIMGLSHQDFPLHGVQFHPESFMTEHGTILIENFLRLGPLKRALGRQFVDPSVSPSFGAATVDGRSVETRAS